MAGNTLVEIECPFRSYPLPEVRWFKLAQEGEQEEINSLSERFTYVERVWSTGTRLLPQWDPHAPFTCLSLPLSPSSLFSPSCLLIPPFSSLPPQYLIKWVSIHHGCESGPRLQLSLSALKHVRFRQQNLPSQSGWYVPHYTIRTSLYIGRIYCRQNILWCVRVCISSSFLCVLHMYSYMFYP